MYKPWLRCLAETVLSCCGRVQYGTPVAGTAVSDCQRRLLCVQCADCDVDDGRNNAAVIKVGEKNLAGIFVTVVAKKYYSATKATKALRMIYLFPLFPFVDFGFQISRFEDVF